MGRGEEKHGRIKLPALGTLKSKAPDTSERPHAAKLVPQIRLTLFHFLGFMHSVVFQVEAIATGNASVARNDGNPRVPGRVERHIWLVNLIDMEALQHETVRVCQRHWPINQRPPAIVFPE